MDQSMKAPVGAAPAAESLEDLSPKNLMIMVLGEQRVTQRPVEALIHLVMPKETRPEGPMLQQMLEALLAQTRELIGEVRAVHESVHEQGEAIVAMAAAEGLGLEPRAGRRH